MRRAHLGGMGKLALSVLDPHAPTNPPRRTRGTRLSCQAPHFLWLQEGFADRLIQICGEFALVEVGEMAVLDDGFSVDDDAVGPADVA